MRYKPWLLAASLIALGTLSARPILAVEPYQDFLRGLQNQGYAELAVEYLQRISQRQDLPDDVRQTLDLEMCNSLRLAAQEAYSAEIAEQRLASAQTYLDKFLKEHPDHPAVAGALNSAGSFSFDRAQALLGKSRGVTDAAAKAKLLTDARTMLEAARPRFQQSLDLSQQQLAALPPAAEPKGPRPTADELKAASTRQDVEFAVIECRFKLALIEYFIAQTFDDPTGTTRKPALEKAAAEFDAIYQLNRTNNEIAMHAHAWHGKVLEELGDTQTALDIYDEVLANSPTTRNPPLDLASLISQVELFRLRLVIKTDPETAVDEATEWLAFYGSWRRTSGYQGVALELVRAQLAQAEKAPAGPAKTKLQRTALTGLAAVAKVDSEFQQEALLLRRELLEKMGSTAGGGTAVESIALGDAMASSNQWSEAAKSYTQAVELATAAKDVKTLPLAKQKLNEARYKLALIDYSQGKMDTALQSALAIVRDNKEDPMAAPASSLAVSCALSLYVSSQDKAAALTQLQKLADYTIKNWPGKSEADDARIALGQVKIASGDMPGGLALLNEVDARSNRYSFALQVIGQTNWRLYLMEKMKPETARKTEDMTRFREQAVKSLQASLDLQKKAAAGEASLPRQLFETQLLVGEIALEGKQTDQALAMLNPLIDEVKKNKPKSLDNVTLRTFVSAVRAHVAAGDTAKASEVGLMLMESGDDTPQVNAVLIDFAKLLGNEVKLAETAVGEAKTPEATRAAQAKLTGSKQLFAKLLEQLSARKQLSLAGMVYIGDASASIAMNDKARQQYERILTMAEEDPNFKASAGKALTRVRAQLVGLLRGEGKFEDASAQVEELIKTVPNALEPRMEKGRILQAWAEQDPSHLDAAIAHWTKVRMLLQPISQKPAEYYEVIYNTAYCLLATKDKAKALLAEKLLKSTLVQSPKLSSADMVVKYNALLKQVLEAQGKAAP